ncbi:MAG: hypothetical protein Q8Q14_11330 [Gemmatimonadales bacterium]|nr:hypothetical protein [Gemmatimonadales bacterium]
MNRPPPLVCGFCAEEYHENQAQPVCQACPLAGLCRHARCPHCGYENPLAPDWLRQLTARWTS